MYLKELFSLFKNTYPDETVEFSKFCALRPPNVLLLKDQPRDQCKCKMHKNFQYKLKALKVDYCNSFWQTSLCDDSCLNNECWRNVCRDCKNGKLFLQNFDTELSLEATWKCWEKDDTGKIRLKTHDGCKGELLDLVLNDWGAFQEHVRIKRIQANAFVRDRESPDCSILQCDFAMAFSCEYQNEIQSALWSRASVNLFTAALYRRDAPCQSFLLASDSPDKGKDAVYTNLMKLANYIKGQDLGDCLIIYSDGPASEFKNKYCVRIISDISAVLNIDVHWKYFATSHGKGVVDGIGGNAKSVVRSKIMSKHGSVVVQSAHDFVEVAGANLKNVMVTEVSEDEIAKQKNEWGDCQNVPGISKVHCIDYSNGVMKMYSKDIEHQLKGVTIAEIHIKQKCLQTPPFEMKDWVIILQEGKEYAGQVVAAGVDGVQVSLMSRKFAQNWRWPEVPDQPFCPFSHVVKKISPPEPAGPHADGQFKFKDII